MAEDGYDHLYAEAFPKVYFQPATQAFEGICIDDMGKEAMQSSLKKIVIQNAGDITSAPKWATFADGVLTLDHKPCSNIDYIDDRAKSL